MEKKRSRKVVIDEIKQKAKEFTKNRKNANNLIDILSHSESDDDDILLACILSFHKVFLQLISSKDLYLEKELTNEDCKDLSKEEKYKLWVRERYSEAIEKLIAALLSQNDKVQELSLSTLLKLVIAEAKSPLGKVKFVSFPEEFYNQILKTLLSDHSIHGVLISQLQEYLSYDDIRFFTLKCLSCELKSISSNVEEVYIDNFFSLLSSIVFPASQDEELSNFVSLADGFDEKTKCRYLKEHKKLFTSVWVRFLRLKLSPGLYRKVLTCIHDKVIPNMSDPLQLSDFLTDSFSVGGAISLLSLNGLFILVNKYNLEYPDFYKKLYSLFEPTIFHAKYKARFFFLADLFLSSTHLPSYLVAAFIKRLARISLTAPASGILMSIPFIYNLINRHPNCNVLLNRSDTPIDIQSDPFDNEETDPAKCNALESSLWEIKTLESHYHPDVVQKCRQIENPLNSQEIDLSDLLELTPNELYEKEAKKKKKTEVPVKFDIPTGLFSTKDDVMKSFWSLK